MTQEKGKLFASHRGQGSTASRRGDSSRRKGVSVRPIEMGSSQGSGSRGMGTGWPWRGSVGIQCRRQRPAKHWCTSGERTGLGTGHGAGWVRAVRDGPYWQGPGARCLPGKHRAGLRGGLDPGTPPGAPQHWQSLGQWGQSRHRDGAGQAGGGLLQPGEGAQQLCEKGWCGGRNTRWGQQQLVQCKPAAGDSRRSDPVPCAAGAGWGRGHKKGRLGQNHMLVMAGTGEIFLYLTEIEWLLLEGMWPRAVLPVEPPSSHAPWGMHPSRQPPTRGL